MADTLKQALEMPLEERKERWRALNEKVRKVSAHKWATDFLAALEASHEKMASPANEQPLHEAEIVPLRAADGDRSGRLLALG